MIYSGNSIRREVPYNQGHQGSARRGNHRWRRAAGVAWVALLGLGGCDSIDPPPPAPTCDQACQDGAAMRATREMMKLLYNLTVQGEPVGPQDHTRPCLFGGTARVFGQASSNAELGTTKVDLTYEFNGCGYLQKDDEAPENYNVTLTGVITQKGTFAAVTGGTTAVEIASEKITLEGTVHDPPIAYSARDCGLVLSQSGNSISGTICERVAGFSF